MIRLQWNGLRIGHHVLVHDETQPGMPLVAGDVTMIQTGPGTNDVAIRIPTTDGGSTVVHPRRLAVHLDRLDPTQECWRCATDVNTALRLRNGYDTAPARSSAH